ncbi:MAG: hypothetical protein MJ148_00730 [Clostridia bacterium]|nr:hypothetical protein [Clostridia bacterium]
MKCRVCGFEIGEDRTYCPMCGTKVEETPKVVSEAADMAWNTRDFPKPKQLEDIEMNWGNGVRTFMAQDASEGFASIAKEEAPKVERKPVIEQRSSDPFELPGQMQKARPAYVPKKYDEEPAKEEAPLWYTQNFTATGIMKTGPAFPLAQDATIQYMHVDTPKPVYKEPVYNEPKYVAPDYDAYKPDYDKAPAPSEKRPEKFNTFIAKNEEFQKLLDKEYERIQAMHAGEPESISGFKANTFVPETKVQAQKILDFEKTIFASDSYEPKYEPKKETRQFDFGPIAKSAESPRPFSYESDVSSLDLNELIADPLNPRFDIHTLEMTIKKLEDADKKLEEQRQGNQSKLEAMKAAREAYFKFLDNPFDDTVSDATPIFAGQTDSADEPMEDQVVIPAAMEHIQVEEAAEEAAEEVAEQPEALSGLDNRATEFSSQAEAEEEEKDAFDETIQNTEDTTEIDEEAVKAYARETSSLTKLPDELMGLYDDVDVDDEEEEGRHRKGGFLKFILAVIIIVAVLEGGILLLQHFLPEAPITSQLTDMHNAVAEAIANAVGKITALFNK